MIQRVAYPGTLRGRVRVPGDKSTSHRAILIGALAAGASRVEGLSRGDDVRATVRIVTQLGARVTEVGGMVEVDGPPEGLVATSGDLDCENSGTTMRLLAGVTASIEGTHRMIGDPSLSRRPMDRVAVPLEMMGARVEGQGVSRTPPLVVTGRRPLSAIHYDVPVPSAQVKSAILLAALSGNGETSVREAVRTRSTTEDMLHQAGVSLTSVDEGAGRVVRVRPGRPTPQAWRVPGDPSQAAFFVVLAAIHADAEIEVAPIDHAPERVGFLDVLERMGASLTRHADGSLTVRSSSLAATEVHAHEIPSVDEVPALAVAAAAAHGITAFRSVSELRIKESDRFAGTLALVRSVGCRAWSEGDDLFVDGVGSASRFEDFQFSVRLDHRMAMAAAVAAAAGRGGAIDGAESVASSYPDFFNDLASLQ